MKLIFCCHQESNEWTPTQYAVVGNAKFSDVRVVHPVCRTPWRASASRNNELNLLLLRADYIIGKLPSIH